MMEILLSSCSTDISSCCSDFAIAKYISIVKAVLNIIHIVAPIILIIMATIDVTKLVTNPDDKGEKIKHSLKNKIVATVIIFFIPYLTNFVINLASYANINAFEITSCWNAADDIATLLNEEDDEYQIMHTPTFTYSGVTKKSDDSHLYQNRNTKSNKKKKTEEKKKDTSVKGKTIQDKIVNYAKKYVGNKYVYGGTSLTNGTDCSGFTMRVYEHFGYTLPRTSSSQSTVGKKVNASDLQKGDLIFYGNNGQVGHVAMYIGGGKIVHASNSKPYPQGGIKITDNYNYRTPIVMRRIIK